ncbi:MAG: hypothetical protein ACOYMF_05965 [Bacteroidales bacterium]
MKRLLTLLCFTIVLAFGLAATIEARADSPPLMAQSTFVLAPMQAIVPADMPMIQGESSITAINYIANEQTPITILEGRQAFTSTGEGVMYFYIGSELNFGNWRPPNQLPEVCRHIQMVRYPLKTCNLTALE